MIFMCHRYFRNRFLTSCGYRTKTRVLRSRSQPVGHCSSERPAERSATSRTIKRTPPIVHREPRVPQAPRKAAGLASRYLQTLNRREGLQPKKLDFGRDTMASPPPPQPVNNDGRSSLHESEDNRRDRSLERDKENRLSNSNAAADCNNNSSSRSDNDNNTPVKDIIITKTYVGADRAMLPPMSPLLPLPLPVFEVLHLLPTAPVKKER
ncbi:unnamed protein product [Trichogramma brassicae]|uniref:Uncharacterized protein n=1 Tax=Trichogramma brassicae TaxID=86971 RepID=A0A6H5IL79_9HYME|nr:unnamed protein product [Trichogramma brassicae]